MEKRRIWSVCSDGGRPTPAAVVGFAAVVLAVTVFGVLRFFISDDAFTYHIDFDVYREGGRAVLDGVPLYEGVFPAGGIYLPFTYPPLGALLFVPIALLPSWAGYIPFAIASALMLVLVTGIVLKALAREYGRTLEPRKIWMVSFVALPVVIWLWPVTHTLLYGQINILLMLLVVADLLLPRTPWPRGMLIGLAAAIKLTPAVFGLIFLVRRQWREAAVSVVSGVVFSAAAWLILPADSRQYWTETLSDPGRIGGLSYAANQSLRGTIARFTGDPEQTVIWYVAAAIVVVAIILVMVRQVAAGAITAAVCTNALLALLVSPVSWAHHWVWVLPMVLVAWSGWAWSRHRGALVLAAATAVVSLLLPMHLYFPAHGVSELDWSLWMKIAGSEFVLLGLLWLGIYAVAPGRNRKQQGDAGSSSKAGNGGTAVEA